MKSYSTYLFDLDGTLLDSRELIHRSFEAALEGFFDASKGLSKKAYEGLVGMPLPKQFEGILAFLGERTKPTAEQVDGLVGKYRRYQMESWEESIRLYPGVDGLLRALRKRGAFLGLVTSRGRQTLNMFLDKLRLKDWFHVVVSPEDTERHKPHPEPVLKALDSVKAKAKQALFVGDSVFDMQAAMAAGTEAYFVTWGFGKISDLNEFPQYTANNLKPLLGDVG